MIVLKKFQIKNMHCTSCAMVIDSDLEDTKGVRSARTSFAKAELEVEFDDEVVALDKIISVIDQTGYQATIKENESG